MRRTSALVGALLFVACTGQDPVPPPPTESGSEKEPNVLPLDTSAFIPQDTAPVEPPNITRATSST